MCKLCANYISPVFKAPKSLMCPQKSTNFTQKVIICRKCCQFIALIAGLPNQLL
jgi:hypothetical protein